MTPQQAKKLLPVLQAFAEGKEMAGGHADGDRIACIEVEYEEGQGL